MSRHFKHLGELKTLLETKKVANDGILVLDKYSDRSEVKSCVCVCVCVCLSVSRSVSHRSMVVILN